MLPVPLPVTVTPPESEAVSVPVSAETFKVRSFEPASTSESAIADKSTFTTVSSVAEISAVGALDAVGASLIAVTVTSTVSLTVPPSPSVIAIVKVRASVGVLSSLLKVRCSMMSSAIAGVALVFSVITKLEPEPPVAVPTVVHAEPSDEY